MSQGRRGDGPVKPVMEAHQGEDSPYWSESRSHVARLVPEQARRVLDVGCNDGTFGASVLAAVPGREVWGIEPHDLDAATAATRLTGVAQGFYPDVRHLPFIVDLALRGRFDYVDSGLLDRTHLRFFTRSSAQELFTSTGYEVEEFFPVVAMGNARFPRTSKVVAKVIGDLSYM